MGYISKYDTKFITFVNRKYNTNFSYFDDYAIWLFEKSDNDEDMYYMNLEKDIADYSNFQTGTPRTRKK